MSTQAGDTSSEKVGLHPFVPEEYVRNKKHVELDNQNVLAYKAPVLSDLLSCLRMNLLPDFFENCMDIGHAIILGLHAYGLCKTSKMYHRRRKSMRTSWSALPSALVSS